MNMFKLFEKKCPVCKTEIKEKYTEGFGKQFCSEEHKEEYRKKIARAQSKGGSCCH